MLNMATDLERAHAYSLVRGEITKLIEVDRNNGNPSLPPKVTTNVPSPPSKKFKSYTTQFYDDTDLDEASDNITAAKRAHRELEMYRHMNIAKYTASSNDSDNSLLFWKRHITHYVKTGKTNILYSCLVSGSRACIQFGRCHHITKNKYQTVNSE